MQKIFLKVGKDKRLRAGHLWVFSNEIREIPAGVLPGDVVEVLSLQGYSYGLAFFNPHSLLSCRLLKTDNPNINESFFADRLRSALQLRRQLFKGSDVYRLVFGESDLLPGLVIDRYGDFFVLQTLTWGMELRIPQITGALLEVFPQAKGVLEKNDARLRSLENLPQSEKVLSGSIPPETEIQLEHVNWRLSLLQGQKTGFFLDQRLNRVSIEKFSAGKKVLDCYCNQGGFAIHAGRAGADEVTAVDISQPAIEIARKNAALNNLPSINFVKEDVADYLAAAANRDKKWDMIILDPPSFTKSKKTINTARKGYEKINKLAVQCLVDGGTLVTASCSHHISESDFLQTVQTAANKSGKQLLMLFRGLQSPDHPVLLSMPETRYLKFFIFRVI